MYIVVTIICLYLYQARRDRKCRWNFDAVCCSSGYVSISGFGGHIVIFDCRSLSQSLTDPLSSSPMVVNHRFSAEISIPFVIVSAIYYLRFSRLFPVAGSRRNDVGHFRWYFEDLSCFRIYYTSGWVAIGSITVSIEHCIIFWYFWYSTRCLIASYV